MADRLDWLVVVLDVLLADYLADYLVACLAGYLAVEWAVTSADQRVLVLVHQNLSGALLDGRRVACWVAQ